MDTNRTTEKTVGALFIIATVASSLGFILLDPILDDPDVLASVAEKETQVIAGAFLLLVDCVAVVIIPVLLFPIFRKHSESLARLYPVSRVIESVVLVIGVVGLLSLLTLSREYANTSTDASTLDISSTALLGVYDWGALLGIMFFFGLAALLLNYFLYQSKLVPRWLSLWGLIAAAMLPIEGAFESFEVSGLALMSLPIAVQEMVFAAWLIVKGFNASAITSETDQRVLDAAG